MQTLDKAQNRARLEGMAAAATLNISQEAREMVAALKPQAHAPRTLTTADIHAFASNLLTQARANATSSHSRAIEQAGQIEALHCSHRIDIYADHAEQVGLLEALASMHGDERAAGLIRDELNATRKLLISQASDARMLSVPGWNLATRSFAQAPA